MASSLYDQIADDLRRRILSGELVSPAPVISIQLRDESKIRHISDTRYFTVLLQRPDQSAPTPINLNGDDISFETDSTSRPGTTALLTFRPGKNTPLPNGMYTLRVQGRDPGNATAGTQDGSALKSRMRCQTLAAGAPTTLDV